MCVGAFLLIMVEHLDDDTTALIVSTSLAPDHVRLFRRGEERVMPILALEKSIDWDTAINALGLTTSHFMKTSFSREKPVGIKRLLSEQWPVNRGQAKVGKVSILAWKLWNFNYVVPGGRHFVSRLLQVTGLHDTPSGKNHNRTVELRRVFHTDLIVCKWAIENKLLLEGEALSASRYTAIK